MSRAAASPASGPGAQGGGGAGSDQGLVGAPDLAVLHASGGAAGPSGRPDVAHDALRLARDVVAAVAGLHRRGAVHGGLDPRCVVRGPAGVGLEPRRGRRAPLEDPDAIPFTAPEVLRGAHPGRRADVYSTAAIVRAVLVGPDAPQPPLEAVRRALFAPPTVPAGAVPTAVSDVLARALDPRWWRRPRTVGPLLGALEEALRAVSRGPLTPTLSPAAAGARVDSWVLEPDAVAPDGGGSASPVPLTPTLSPAIAGAREPPIGERAVDDTRAQLAESAQPPSAAHGDRASPSAPGLSGGRGIQGEGGADATIGSASPRSITRALSSARAAAQEDPAPFLARSASRTGVVSWLLDDAEPGAARAHRSSPSPPGLPGGRGIQGEGGAGVAVGSASSSTGARKPRSALGRGRTLAVAMAAGVGVLFAITEPGGDAALAREVAARLANRDLAGAREVLDAAERRGTRGPLVQKLRGDLAFARGAQGECLRRYRLALAAEPRLRDDEALRANARQLLARSGSCGTKKAAAELLGELRDPEALPALEEARRSRGLFGFFCTGDALDRAIAATRAAGEDEPR